MNGERPEQGDIAREQSETITSLRDLRSDFHMHTLTSREAGDPRGTYTMEELAGYIEDHVGIKEGEKPGVEYISITDHATNDTVVPQGPEEKVDQRILAQKVEIDRLNESGKFPGLTVLAGTETALSPEGVPDVSNHVLEQLDVVVASIHEPPDLSGEERMAAYRQAVENPYIDILGHPFGATWWGKSHDWLSEEQSQELIDLAIEHDKAIEINVAQLDHYPSTLLQIIAASGVKVSMGTDTHDNPQIKDQKPLGVSGWRPYARTARAIGKAGIKKENILNTYSLAEYRAWRQTRIERFTSPA
ncbi:hypothetical protein KJ903_02960 [Patescibacteria group bacterium]|nr:hypothetical protein [Patescibacteria group bacterium]